MPEVHDRLITEIDAREYFQGEVQSALQNQDIDVSGETVVYLVNLLTTFIDSDHLFEQSADGVMLKSLAMHYKEAREARTINERLMMLRRLGDVALFISGMLISIITLLWSVMLMVIYLRWENQIPVLV
jgi:hypothetical protein